MGENPEVYSSKASAELNRTTIRPRPSPGGKFTLYAAPEANPVEPVLKRWRRTVTQHALQPQHPSVVDPRVVHSGDVAIDLDVVHDDNITSLVGSVHDETLLATKKESSEVHVNVSIPVSEGLASTNFSEQEDYQEGEGSNATFEENYPDSDPNDYQIFSYGQDKVNFVRQSHESVTLESGVNEIPQHTSPDANKLNNDIHEHLPIIPSDRSYKIQDSSDPLNEDKNEEFDEDNNTEKSFQLKLKTEKPYLSFSVLPSYPIDETTHPYRIYPNTTVSADTQMAFHPGNKTREPYINSTSMENVETETSEHVKISSSKHESILTILPVTESDSNISVADTFNIDISNATNNLLLTNTSDATLPVIDNVLPKPPKRVLVNVTVAMQDEALGLHQSVYVFSMSVSSEGNTSGSLAEVNVTHPALKVANALIGLNGSDDTHMLLTHHQEQSHTTSHTTTSTTTLTPLLLGGAVCECSCPCLDQEGDYSEIEGSTSNPLFVETSIITGSEVEDYTSAMNKSSEENEKIRSVSHDALNYESPPLSTIIPEDDISISTLLSSTNSPNHFTSEMMYNTSEENIPTTLIEEETTYSETTASVYASDSPTPKYDITTSSTEASSSGSYTTSPDCTSVLSSTTPSSPIILILEGEAMFLWTINP